MPGIKRDTRLGVIVVARNERTHLRRTVENLLDTVPTGTDLLVVDDESADGCCRFLASKRAPARLVRAGGLGVAGARNLGAARSRGEVLIFCDAHLWLDKDWWRPLAERAADPRTGGASPLIVDADEPRRIGGGLHFEGPALLAGWLAPRKRPGRVPILPGACLAIRRKRFFEAGGFDGGMICSGGVDNEFCLRLWLLGYEQWVEPSVRVRHLFRTEQPYPVGFDTILHNRLRLALIHFKPARIERVARALCREKHFPAALALTAGTDIAERRSYWAARRIRDDDWFFRRFAKVRTYRNG